MSFGTRQIFKGTTPYITRKYKQTGCGTYITRFDGNLEVPMPGSRVKEDFGAVPSYDGFIYTPDLCEKYFEMGADKDLDKEREFNEELRRLGVFDAFNKKNIVAVGTSDGEIARSGYSLKRSKGKVSDICENNMIGGYSAFLTATTKEKYTSIKAFIHNRIKPFVRIMRENENIDISQWIYIIEKHLDGSLHVHFVLFHLTKWQYINMAHMVKKGKKNGVKRLVYVQEGELTNELWKAWSFEGYIDAPYYNQKTKVNRIVRGDKGFDFIDTKRIGYTDKKHRVNNEKCNPLKDYRQCKKVAKYISKYLTKDNTALVRGINSYHPSNGLKKNEFEFTDQVYINREKGDYIDKQLVEMETKGGVEKEVYTFDLVPNNIFEGSEEDFGYTPLNAILKNIPFSKRDAVKKIVAPYVIKGTTTFYYGWFPTDKVLERDNINVGLPVSGFR